MRKFLAILVCKLAALAGRIVGRGSSKPGALALKICPDILSRLVLPETVAAVTGSNGKTSAVELVVKILQDSGKKVCWNREGSNQTEGVATMLLNASTLGGRVKADVIVMESDERYARLTFRYLKPTHFMILNILRDQMTRNGHPEFICGKIADAVSDGMRLIVNADDPLCVLAAGGRETVGFGLEKAAVDGGASGGVYDDGKFCPVCGGEMVYGWRGFGALGDFSCPACGHSRGEPKYRLTAFDAASGTMTVAESGGAETEMTCGIRSLHHAYNMLAAFALCRELGVPAEAVKRSISDYFLTNGRIRCWDQAGRRLVLMTSKHENSVSYNYSLSYAAREGGSVLVIVDAVSRKYFTGETSWLWDIDFDRLAADSVRSVWLAGKYVWDIAQRLEYSAVPPEKVNVLETLDGIRDMLARETGDVYVVTCFSDRDKFLSRLPADAAERREM